jgi:16S rRNA (cytidine1402-2'-O)-methyltransferase
VLEAGLPVDSIPGPSAVINAIVLSGFPMSSFVFAGFPPSKPKARRDWLFGLSTETRAIVMFEAPHRVRQTLEEMREVLGDRTVAVLREMTKIHQELVKKPISAVLDGLGEPIGEFTLVVQGRPISGEQPNSVPADGELFKEYCQMTESAGISRRDAVSTLAARYRLGSREVYSALERGKTPSS